MTQSSRYANPVSSAKFANGVTHRTRAHGKIGFMRLSNRRPFYLKQWRQHRQLTQQKLADRLEVTKGYISELERGIKRYNQDVLEALADALMCQPADLLMRDPSQEDGIWSIWETLPLEKRKQALAVIKALTDAA